MGLISEKTQKKLFDVFMRLHFAEMIPKDICVLCFEYYHTQSIPNIEEQHCKLVVSSGYLDGTKWLGKQCKELKPQAQANIFFEVNRKRKINKNGMQISTVKL